MKYVSSLSVAICVMAISAMAEDIPGSLETKIWLEPKQIYKDNDIVSASGSLIVIQPNDTWMKLNHTEIVCYFVQKKCEFKQAVIYDVSNGLSVNTFDLSINSFYEGVIHATYGIASDMTSLYIDTNASTVKMIRVRLNGVIISELVGGQESIDYWKKKNHIQ